MQKIAPLRQFMNNVGDGDVERTAKILGLKPATVQLALDGTKVADVYRKSDLTYGLYTLQPIKDTSTKK